MKVSLKSVRNQEPSPYYLDALLGGLGYPDDDEEISPIAVLNHCGLDVAAWFLRFLPYKEYSPLIANVAECILCIFEKEVPDNKSMRCAIHGIRKYATGVYDMNRLRECLQVARDCHESQKNPSPARYAIGTVAYSHPEKAIQSAISAVTSSIGTREEIEEKITYMFQNFFKRNDKLATFGFQG